MCKQFSTVLYCALVFTSRVLWNYLATRLWSLAQMWWMYPEKREGLSCLSSNVWIGFALEDYLHYSTHHIHILVLESQSIPRIGNFVALISSVSPVWFLQKEYGSRSSKPLQRQSFSTFGLSLDLNIGGCMDDTWISPLPMTIWILCDSISICTNEERNCKQNLIQGHHKTWYT